LVIPAEAGIQNYLNWTPASAGVTTGASTLPNVVAIVELLITLKYRFLPPVETRNLKGYGKSKKSFESCPRVKTFQVTRSKFPQAVMKEQGVAITEWWQSPLL
jgi:hypothetical protein